MKLINVLHAMFWCALFSNSVDAQRRFLEKQEGILFGVGAALGHGPKNSSSVSGYGSFSFTDGLEFVVSGGSVSADETTDHFSPAVEIYGSEGYLRPFVDIVYTKATHTEGTFHQSASLLAGASFDILQYRRVLLAPEIGYGMILGLGDNGESNKPLKVWSFGLSSGIRLSKSSLVFINGGAAKTKDKWTESIGLGIVFG